MAISRPSGEKATQVTSPVWPISVPRQTPVSASQTRIVRSQLPEAINWPSGEIATEVTMRVWPASVWMAVPSGFQTRTVLSQPAVASQSPFGEKAMAVTTPP